MRWFLTLYIKFRIYIILRSDKRTNHDLENLFVDCTILKNLLSLLNISLFFITSNYNHRNYHTNNIFSTIVELNKYITEINIAINNNISFDTRYLKPLSNNIKKVNLLNFISNNKEERKTNLTIFKKQSILLLTNISNSKNNQYLLRVLGRLLYVIEDTTVTLLLTMHDQ